MDLPKKALKAKQKGEKEIPKFRDWFPHGENYEVFRFGFYCQLAKCDLVEPFLHYIAHNRHEVLFGTFAEFDLQLEPHWAFIYHRDVNAFTFAPMTITQENAIAALNQDFFSAWLSNESGKVNPGKSQFMPIHFVRDKRFQNSIKICEDLCYKAWDTIQESSDLAGLNPMVAKISEKINQRYRSDISLEKHFDVLLERSAFLSHLLNEELGPMVRFFSRGASKKKIVGAILLGTPPPTRLGVPQTYLFPNGTKSLLVNLSVHTGSGRIRLFENFGPTYELIKGLYSSSI